MIRCGCVSISAACLLLASGVAQAATMRVVSVPNTFINIGFDAFNNGGAIGSASSASGTVGYISRSASNNAVVSGPGGASLTFRSASATGSTIAGTTTPNGTAVRYTTSTGVQSLGTLPGDTTSDAWRVSSDGTTIVGESTGSTGKRAFRWNGGSMQDLGAVTTGASTSARAVNADGSVVVGYSGSTAFRWSSGVMQDIGAGAGFTNMSASAVSEDGDTIYGTADGLPYRWTPSGVTLLNNSLGLGSQIIDCSDDGSVAVGNMSISGSTRAVAWFGNNIVNLNTWLPTQGVNLNGWTLNIALGVSSDGRTIAASGNNGAQIGTLVIVLDAPLPLIIPAPGAASLAMVGGLACLRRRRR